MSYPAATIILSDRLPSEHQGLAASLVNMVANYSVSITLGIAGAREVSTNKGGHNMVDLEHGIRCASYTGVGFGGCGLIIGGIFFAQAMWTHGWKVTKN